MRIIFDLIIAYCRTLKQWCAFFGLTATVLLAGSLAEAQVYLLPDFVKIELSGDQANQGQNIRKAGKIDRALLAAYQVFSRQNSSALNRAALLEKLVQDLGLETADIEAAMAVYQVDGERILWTEKSWSFIQRQIDFGFKDLSRFRPRTAVQTLIDIRALKLGDLRDELFIGATASLIPLIKDMFLKLDSNLKMRWSIVTQLLSLPIHSDSVRMYMQIWLDDVLRIVDVSVYEKQILNQEFNKFLQTHNEADHTQVLLLVANGLLSKTKGDSYPNWSERQKFLQKINVDLLESSKQDREKLAIISQAFAKNIIDVLRPARQSIVSRQGRDLVLVEMLRLVQSADLLNVIQNFAHPDSRYDYTSDIFKNELLKRIRAEHQSLKNELPSFLEQLARSQSNSEKLTKLSFVIALKDLFRDGSSLQMQFEGVIFDRARNIIIQAADDFDRSDIETGMKLIDSIASLLPRTKFLQLLNEIKLEIESAVRLKLQSLSQNGTIDTEDNETYLKEDLKESPVYQKILRYLQAQNLQLQGQQTNVSGVVSLGAKLGANSRLSKNTQIPLPDVCSRLLGSSN